MWKNVETLESQTSQLVDGAPGLGFLSPCLTELETTAAFDAAASGSGSGTSGGDSSSPEGSPLASRAPPERGSPLGSPLGGATSRLHAAARKLLGSGPRRGVGRVSSSTGRRFLRDMGSLMRSPEASASHFVHCVKPNGMQQSELRSYEMVAEQLTSLGNET